MFRRIRRVLAWWRFMSMSRKDVHAEAVAALNEAREDAADLDTVVVTFSSYFAQRLGLSDIEGGQAQRRYTLGDMRVFMDNVLAEAGVSGRQKIAIQRALDERAAQVMT